MNWVSQRTTSSYVAVLMTPKQAFEILANIPEPRRTLTLSDAATALRVSELASIVHKIRDGNLRASRNQGIAAQERNSTQRPGLMRRHRRHRYRLPALLVVLGVLVGVVVVLLANSLKTSQLRNCPARPTTEILSTAVHAVEYP